MLFFVIALSLLLAGGTASLLANRNDRAASRIGVAGVWSGTLAALTGMVLQFRNDFETEPDIAVPDPAGCIFLLPILILGAVAALHAVGYLTHGGKGRYGVFFFWFNAMIAAMILVTMAQSPVWFLSAWELMGLTSFALVAYDYHEKRVIRAGWIYLLAGHAGAALLILMFLAISREMSPVVIFLLAAAGFGLKAGFPLLHVWLPEAHPAAPAPVSAVMSGGMINLGFYGLMHFGIQRAGLHTGTTEFYGIFLALTGMAGALIGVLPALAQNNLKRLLAFSSVENIGLITMGLGFGFLGYAHEIPIIQFCGFCAAILHVWNHAVLKGTLFLAAGEILRSTGTLEIDRLGGIAKRLPLTGALFTGAGTALAGLPPFNAFISEFLLYWAAFAGVVHLNGAGFVISLLAIPVLGMIGAFACGVYAKAIGGVFLGEPRSDAAIHADPTPRSVTAAMLILMVLAAALLLASPWLCGSVLLLPLSPGATADMPARITGTIGRIVAFSAAAMILIPVLYWLSHCRRPQIRRNVTWDCGYAAPTARMEYTGTAITQPLCDYWRKLTGYCRCVVSPRGLFPDTASADVEGHDPGVSLVWHPIFRNIVRAAEKIHILQSGLLHFYILLIVLGLAALLCWGWLAGPVSSPQPPSAAVEHVGGVR